MALLFAKRALINDTYLLELEDFLRQNPAQAIRLIHCQFQTTDHMRRLFHLLATKVHGLFSLEFNCLKAELNGILFDTLFQPRDTAFAHRLHTLSLTLYSSPLQFQGNLSHLTALQRVEFACSTINQESMRALATLPQLDYVSFESCETHRALDVFELLASKSLQCLVLQAIHFTHTNANGISKTLLKHRGIPLHTFVLRDCSMSDDTFVAIINVIGAFSNVSTFEIRTRRVIPIPPIVNCVRRNHSLRHLYIDAAPFSFISPDLPKRPYEMKKNYVRRVLSDRFTCEPIIELIESFIAT